MHINIADGNDRVAVQVGQVLGRRREPSPDMPEDAGPVESTNVRAGNARVGRQVDEITGDVWL